MIIYCHGLGSSGQAEKANILRQTCSDIGVLAPDLPLEPEKAVTRIEREIAQAPKEPCLLVGSSLGGFYALYLHQRKGLPVVLLNPATHPFQERHNSASIQRHLDTTVAWQDEYSRQLERMQYTGEQVNPDRLWVYLAKDDELLDYRRAAEFFAVNKCKVKILETGGHRLFNFAEIVPQIRAIYFSLA